MSTVNVAEALSSEVSRGIDPARLAEELSGRGLLDGALTVYPFTTADAIEAGRLRPLTRAAGLSLGDRACLALAHRLDGVAMTADTAWARVELDVTIKLIREDAEAAASLASVRGAWRGRVHLAEDFDELPEDIAETFGDQ